MDNRWGCGCMSTDCWLLETTIYRINQLGGVVAGTTVLCQYENFFIELKVTKQTMPIIINYVTLKQVLGSLI